jgi:AraC family transcriptional regulator of adaptative response/methylated-DNA-[protein]-cysteine methyltransferase
VGLSEYHFQRVFTRWAGISPKRFLQYLTKEYARDLLQRSENVLEAAYAAGLSGPGRLHDLFVTWEAVTPGQVRSLGEGLLIQYGFTPSPFGECLLARTERGICYLAFVDGDNREAALAGLRRWMKRAVLVEDSSREIRDETAALASRIFDLAQDAGRTPLPIFLQGTSFQLKVWEALLRIPAGRLVSYEDIANHIGARGASRAVGQAVGRNPVPLLIPCHRVIRKAGDFNGYRYGLTRKKALLLREMVYAEP